MKKRKSKNRIRRIGLLLLFASFFLCSCRHSSEKEKASASVLSPSEMGGVSDKASDSELKLKLDEKIKTEQEEALSKHQN